MKMNVKTTRATTLAIALIALLAPTADARVRAVEASQRTAEIQIRNLIGPVLEKYCHDECKLLSITASVDVSVADSFSPGFEDRSPAGADLSPSGADIKLLVDDKVGPVSRGKIIDLVQQHLDTLDYPVKLDIKLAHFPPPIGSTEKANEIRERVSKQFRSVIDELFAQFCPEQCLLADYNLKTELVNGEEASYGSAGEFVTSESGDGAGGVAVRIKSVSGTILVDDSLSPEERANIIEMARLKTNYLKNVNLSAKAMKFPHPTYAAGRPGGRGRGLAGDGSGTDSRDSRDSKSSATDNRNSSEKSDSSSNKLEKYERTEKIERVEQGDAIHEELKRFKTYGAVIAGLILLLLALGVYMIARPRSGVGGSVTRVIQSLTSDPASNHGPSTWRGGGDGPTSDGDRAQLVARRYEIERLCEELMAVFSTQPKVAKQVFSRVLTEEGVEITSRYVQIFGESIVMDMMRDPSLQSDMSELMEYYAKNPTEIKDDEKLDLLRRLHNRAVAGKLVVMGNRSSNLFDFLSEMDGPQISELVRTEALTVKAIVLTQSDAQKRAAVYASLDEDTRMKLLTELSRIDYLPRDYIFNVAHALKRKRRDNPRLNTEALPGSDVLIGLLERTSSDQQRAVLRSLEATAPESARTIKSRLVSIDTLRYLRDSHLLEVVLNLKHEELLTFLKGGGEEARAAIFGKAPSELVLELEDELVQVSMPSRETYQTVERKVLNRMKLMAQEGVINLVEINDQMFSEPEPVPSFIAAGPAMDGLPLDAAPPPAPRSARIKAAG